VKRDLKDWSITKELTLDKSQSNSCDIILIFSSSSFIIFFMLVFFSFLFIHHFHLFCVSIFIAFYPFFCFYCAPLFFTLVFVFVFFGSYGFHL
jgi:hypothetical protein